MAGTFGYELDLTKLNDEEIQFLAAETKVYNKYSDLIRNGDYYRLTSNDVRYIGWQFVSADKTNSLAVLVEKNTSIDYKPIIQRFYGLEENMMYRVIIDGQERESLYSGTSLMQIGLNIRTIKYEGDSTRIEIVAKND